MAEKLTLAVPDQQTPAAPDYSIGGLMINLGYVEGPIATPQDVERAYISVLVVSSNGVQRRVRLWEGAQAVQVARQFNTVNLSSKSLNTRLLERLAVVDARFAGAISGAPDAP